MTFIEWLNVWGDKFPLRGRGAFDLCMARVGDVGPYEAGNIYITTNRLNTQSKRGDVLAQAGLKAALKLVGRGRGWKYESAYPNKPYRVYSCQKYVGHFATQDEAESAFKAAATKRIATLRGLLLASV